MKKFGLVLIAGLSLNAMAATTTTTQTSVNISEQNRADKSLQVTAGFGLNYSLPTLGVQGSMLLDEQKSINIGLYSFKDSNTSDGYGYDTDPLYKGTVVEMNYKQFTGNSFYVQGGMYYRNATTIDSHTSIYLDEELIGRTYEGRTSFVDTGITAKIGNQWQWDNFTMGCDWVGVSKSVAMLEQNGDKSAKYPNATNLTLVNFYLGATF